MSDEEKCSGKVSRDYQADFYRLAKVCDEQERTIGQLKIAVKVLANVLYQK